MLDIIITKEKSFNYDVDGLYVYNWRGCLMCEATRLPNLDAQELINTVTTHIKEWHKVDRMDIRVLIQEEMRDG